MELSAQLKKYRGLLNMSQEDLAEKIYVTRQTISNWENEKSYPDIHSLVMLSELFEVSLDELIKGDVIKMKEEINKSDIKEFSSVSAVFTVLLIVTVFVGIPMILFLGWWGFAAFALLWGVTMYFALKVEKLKKKNDIQTYKEILSFTEGKRLDEIQTQREIGKRPYQKVLAFVLSAVISAAVAAICILIISLIK